MFANLGSPGPQTDRLCSPGAARWPRIPRQMDSAGILATAGGLSADHRPRRQSSVVVNATWDHSGLPQPVNKQYGFSKIFYLVD